MKVKPGILQEMRLAAGFTQLALAKRLGLTRSAIAQTEYKGDDVKLSTVLIWADVMGCEVSVKVTSPKGETITVV